MKSFGLLGFPLSHSFSKSYFTKKFENENIDAQYNNYALENVADMIAIARKDAMLQGFNVTIPHKQAIIPFLDKTDDCIAEIGAVNVVKIIRNGENIQFNGFNTDIVGFEKSFVKKLTAQHKQALILGTGGSSKAVAYILKKLNIGFKYVSRNANATNFDYTQLTEAILAQYQIIINCSPVGMYPNTYQCPQIPYQYLTPNHYLYDLVYNPEETLFLAKGKEAGAATCNGLEMLQFQAEAAWDIWNS